MHFNLSPLEITLIFLVMSIGATLQGAAGYGMALVAGPVLMLIEPDLIPGPMVISAFLLVILVIFRDRQALDFLGLKWAVIGFIPGVALGIFFLKRFSGEQFATLFALLILLVVLMSAVGLRFKANKPTLTIAGFSAGLMSVLTTTSGPPIALVYQDAPGKKLRATISGFFVAGTIFVVSSLLLVGELGVRELSLSLLLIPGILVGFLASRRVANWVDRGYTRPVVLLISGLSAIVVLINQLWR